MNISSNSKTSRLEPAPSNGLGISRFWSDLSLARKLLIAFSALALLALVVGVVANVGLNNVQKSYQHSLADGEQMKTTSLTLSNDLLTARRHEKDFLLHWTETDFDTATTNYVVPNQEAVAAMQKDIDALSQHAPAVGETFSATYPQAQFESDVAVLKESTNTYEQNFLKMVQLTKEKGFQDAGLEGEFRVAVHDIEDRILGREGLDSLTITMLTIRRHEKDYLLRGDQTYIDQVHEAVSELKQQITTSDVLSSSEKSEMRTLTDRYSVAFDALVEKNIEIADTIQAFRDAAHTMEPLAAKLQDTGAKMSEIDVTTAQTTSSRTLLYSSITLIAALFVAILLSVALSRQITGPVRLLTETAHELETGNYDVQADINTGDEVGILAKTFNGMARQIKQTLAAIAQRAAELQTVSEVSTSASTVLDTKKLLWNVANLTKEQFRLYHAHIYMMNETGDTLVLAAGAGEAGLQMVSEGRKISFDNERSLVARATRERKGIIVNDVRSAQDFLPHPLLPNTRAELAVPMIVGDKVLGVFDVQSDVVNSFTQENADIQTIMATQIAVAVQNANLFAQAENNAQQARSLVDNAPEAIVVIDLTTGLFVDSNGNAAKLFGISQDELIKVGPAQVSPLTQLDGRNSVEASMEQIGNAMQGKTPVFEWTHCNAQGQNIPCEIRLVRVPGEHSRVRASVTDITARKQAEALIAQRAKQLETVAAISSASATILEQEKLLQAVVDLTKERFDLYHTHIYVMDEATNSLVLTSGAGEVGRKMVADGRSIPANAEKSLVARAARERKAVIVNDVQSEPDFLANPLLPDTRSEMAVPLIVGDKVLGVLDVQANIVDHFTQEDISIQSTLAVQIAISMQNARTFAQAQGQARREAMLNTISQKIQSATTVESVLQIAARELGRAINAPFTVAQLGVVASNGDNGNGH